MAQLVTDKEEARRTCWLCGYFGARSPKARQTDGCSGRCYGFDNEAAPEALLITEGTEDETAAMCRRYFRRSQHLSVGEFIAWRNGVANDLHKQVTERQFRIITLLLAGCAFVDFACKAMGVWK